MKLNHKSWHYRMANYGMKRIWREDKTDFCSYSRMVMSGLFLRTVLWSFVSTMIIWTGYTWYQFYLNLTQRKPLNDFALLWIITLVSCIGAAIVVTGVVQFSKWKTERKYKKHKDKSEPTFFSLMYRKWKEKTCFMVEID